MSEEKSEKWVAVGSQLYLEAIQRFDEMRRANIEEAWLRLQEYKRLRKIAERN